MPNQNPIDPHFEEAKQTWGHTEAWKQSEERTKNWTREDYNRVAAQYAEIHQAVAEWMKRGETPDSPLVQAEIQKHHSLINCFYDCAPQMYKSLGEMYIMDPRFKTSFDHVDPDLAVFFVNAMHVFCDKQFPA